MYLITEEIWHKYGKRWSLSDPLREGPFLMPPATALLEALLHPRMEVLEYGAGGSTIWLAERVAHVVSVETDKDWYMKVFEELSRRSLASKVTQLFDPGLLKGKFAYDFSDERFDLIYVDGNERGRVEFIENTIMLTKVMGWYVIDNANRPVYQNVMNRVNALGWPSYIVPSLLPALYYQTNFYRRPCDTEGDSL